MDIIDRLSGRPLGEARAMSDEPGPAPEKLRTSEVHYRRLFESAPDGILVLDASTLKITDVNPLMMELSHYSRDEFLGRQLWEIGLFRNQEASQDALREVQTKGYLRFADLPLHTRHGEVRDVEFICKVYLEGEQQVIQCNIRDLTNQKRLEKERQLILLRALESAQAARTEADAANHLKDEFFAILSHDIRTPLTSILGWSYMLTESRLDERSTKRAIETIARNARLQRNIIDNLLDVSRIIMGKLHLDLRPLELPQLIASVVDGMRPAAEAKDIHLQTTLEAPVSRVSGDPQRVQQIVRNLLSNAIKFTPAGGCVDVRLEPTPSHVEIIISDTGQGLEPELLLNVFERSRQSDTAGLRRHGGVGLGLSIVRQLVELHGGTVTAKSPGLGKGTTFTVHLPVTSVHGERRAAAMKRPATRRQSLVNWQPPLTDLRVLVVDDEADARELVAAVLERRGAEVISVGSAGQALEEIERRRFDVLVSDIMMPETDGYALINQVRQLPAERGGRIPAAAVSAATQVEDRMRALMAGYQMHIPKPVEPDELTTLVANLAGRYAKPIALAASTRST